ncbi:YcdB/YcdC domain-containing protein [Bacillus sp. JJ1562]|uniref:YcdB/YcdC domain-containing protein n=1 Tax=Bacillus sp. JJ1562 TaxID=3122960 RepID=UPI0030010FCE
MSKMIEKLQPFLTVNAYEKASEYDEDSFDIIEVETDETIGSYSLNEKGELVGFSLWDEPPEGNHSKDQMAAIAQNFVDTFYPEQKEFELSGILDLDNPYMITYEKRDEKYGIFLHSTGFTVSVSTSGQITSFYCADEDYEVRYSDIVVSEEKALETYIEGLDFEVIIQKFNSEVYKNGDNQYHLSYSVIEQVMDIPVDGSDTTSIHEGYALESAIQKQETPTQNVYELIGLTAEYKLLDKQVEEGRRIEIWSTNDNVDEYTFEKDETDDHVIKLCFDEKTNMLLEVLSGEEYENHGEEEIGLESAKGRALEVMFKFFSDTHERYRLEVPEDEIDDFDDEMEEFDEEDFTEEEFIDEEFDEDDIDEDEWVDKYIEHEDVYTFYFHLHHKGIRVDQHVTLISVGKYTGKITHVNLDVPDQNLYLKLPTTPTISTNEAKGIYKKYVKMELMFTREYDEDGKSIYTLAYVPDFPDTIGSVRAIDAVTGKAMYVDVGDATFIK